MGKADVFLPSHFIWEAKRAQTNSARAKALGVALLRTWNQRKNRDIGSIQVTAIATQQ
ncbi:hypothetical protein [Deinococcus aquatilis]|uniref:hypothetical protein n=1 Tax=Deinococcus aquatilis TaxID=519440 RepID=UPI0003663197|nr:hypothetical protein [Deinococcus aquatilis]